MKKQEYDKKRYEENREYILKQSKQYYQNNKDKILKRQKIYNKKYKELGKKYREERRLKVLNIISEDNPHCVRCGCDDIRLLEINHKNGGGAKETQGGILATKFYNDIRNGKRKTDDLEILCKICNAQHYLELKFGELPYDVFYNKEGNK